MIPRWILPLILLAALAAEDPVALRDWYQARADATATEIATIDARWEAFLATFKDRIAAVNAGTVSADPGYEAVGRKSYGNEGVLLGGCLYFRSPYAIIAGYRQEWYLRQRNAHERDGASALPSAIPEPAWDDYVDPGELEGLRRHIAQLTALEAWVRQPPGAAGF
jgi:hypothetical protein